MISTKQFEEISWSLIPNVFNNGGGSGRYNVLKSTSSIKVKPERLKSGDLFIYATKLNDRCYVLFFEKTDTRLFYLDSVVVFDVDGFTSLYPLYDLSGSEKLYVLDSVSVPSSFITTLPLSSDLCINKKNSADYYSYFSIAYQMQSMLTASSGGYNVTSTNLLESYMLNIDDIEEGITKSLDINFFSNVFVTLMDIENYTDNVENFQIHNSYMSESDVRNNSTINLTKHKNEPLYFTENYKSYVGCEEVVNGTVIANRDEEDNSHIKVLVSVTSGNSSKNRVPPRNFNLEFNLTYSESFNGWLPVHIRYKDNLTGGSYEYNEKYETLLGSEIRAYIYWPISVDLVLTAIGKYPSYDPVFAKWVFGD